MNKNINLCEILKGHEGETFYSPIFGNLTLFAINFQILEFTSIENDTVAIESSGKFYNKADEICVFPSKDQRDWNKWIEGQKPKVPKTWSELYNNDDCTIYNLSKIDRVGCDVEIDGTPIEKSALALLKIHKLIEVGYGGNITKEEWKNNITIKFTIVLVYNTTNNKFEFIIHETTCINIIAFHTKEQAKEFLSKPENVELLKDYFMI